MRPSDPGVQDTLLDWLRFALTPGTPRAEQRELLRRFGSPRAALAAREKGPDARVVDLAWKWLETSHGHFIALGDPEYPRALLETADPPTAFFARGRIELLNAPAIAVVGSRNATPQGRRDAEHFAHALSEAGLTVVSGLALGIDTAAHRGGLAGRSSSVAVMGTGPDIIYPRANRELGERLAIEGAVITEFAPGTPPLPGHFPDRNRILSGLARGVLVVEAAHGSGSLITARCAVDEGREVLAMPGSIHAPLARGCHWLIRRGAKLVECVDDILEECGLPCERSAGEPVGTPSGKHDALLDALGYAPASVDDLTQRTGKSAASVAARLAELEIEGRVAALSGGRFQRTAAP